MKTYLELRDSTKAAYLRHHDSILVRLHLANPWGHLADENAFNRVHAACVKAIALHGPFDVGQNYGACATFTADRFAIDRNEAIKAVITAVLAIVITLLFPPAAIIAGFLADLFVGLICLVLAEMAVEFVSGCYGAAPEQHASQLNAWAAEAAAA
jgi:hypothetical protein